MKNLEACMQQGVATSPTTIGARSNIDLPMVEVFNYPLKINLLCLRDHIWSCFEEKSLCCEICEEFGCKI